MERSFSSLDRFGSTELKKKMKNPRIERTETKKSPERRTPKIRREKRKCREKAEEGGVRDSVTATCLAWGWEDESLSDLD